MYNKDAKEIREIMTDLKMITESFTFNETLKSEENKEDISDVDVPVETDDIESNETVIPETKNIINIDSDIKNIRKIALSAITKITPTDNQEAYKLVKSIWDSCDKFLIRDDKGTQITKKENNNI